MKNSNKNTGNRTRDLPVFNVVLPLLDKRALNFVKRQRRPIGVHTCLFSAMLILHLEPPVISTAFLTVIIIIIIIGIQPLGRSGQRPDFSQATGMALVRCILGKFLGVACHCFPPLFRSFHFSPPGASTSSTT